MRNIGHHNRLLGASALVALAAVAQPAASYAQARTYSFDIPAQELSNALREFARASGHQVIFDARTMRGLRSKPLSGNFTVQQGLDRLLSGTGFSAEATDGGMLMIKGAGDTSSLQGVNATSSQTADLGGADEIVVTGTSIPGQHDLSVPVITMKREQIERSGYSSTEHLLRDLPQNLGDLSSEGIYAQGVSQIAQQNGQRASGVSLRGLGAGSTLTLLNGKRFAGNIQGRVMDISMIPIAALERVEVVTGGRSAVYGADAVAGVVNFITRRSFDGADTKIYFGAPTNVGGGERLQISQTGGLKSDRGGFVLSYDYAREQELDLINTGLIRGASRTGVVPLALDLRPKSRRHSALFAGSYEINDRIEVYGDGLFSTRHTVVHSRTQMPTSVVNADQIYRGRQYAGNGGVKVRLDGDWMLDANVLRSSSAVRSNLFIESIEASRNVTRGIGRDRSTLSGGSAIVSGMIQLLGSKRLLVSGGVEIRKESLHYVDNYSSNNRPYVSINPINISRNVSSLFSELVLPIAHEGSSIPGMHRLELSAAGRLDRYSDAGSTFNPQLGVIWEPLNGLTIRASYSTAFRAPDLYNLGIPQRTVTIRTLQDPTAPSGVSPVLDVGGNGNPDLRPEKARTFSVGGDFRPAAAPWLHASISYFKVYYRDRIAPPFGTDLTRALTFENDFGGLINRAPTAREVAALIASDSDGVIGNQTTTPFDPTTQDPLSVFPGLVTILSRTSNIGVEKASGIDYSLAANFHDRLGEWSFSLRGVYNLNRTTQLNPVSPILSVLNAPGKPVDLRFNVSGGFNSRWFGASLNVHYVDSYKDTLSSYSSRISSWTTVDLNIQIDTSEWMPDGPTLSFHVLNLTNESPPRVMNNDSGVPYDGANANAEGRFVGIRVSKKW